MLGQAPRGVHGAVGEVQDVRAHGGQVLHRLSTPLLPQPEPAHMGEERERESEREREIA